MMAGLAAQNAWRRLDIDLGVHVLAYGCRDDTVAKAQWSAPDGFRVHELAQAGRAQTWNCFVHDLSRRDADVLVFCDAGISLPADDCLTRLIHDAKARPDVQLRSSRPIRDSAFGPPQAMIGRLVDGLPGGGDDWCSAICGQLYAMPSGAARRYLLPIGLPVEDGFLRALVLSNRFFAADDPAQIAVLDGLYHLYPAERTVGGSIRRQTRLVAGLAINAAVFRHLEAEGILRIAPELLRAAADAGWLRNMLRLRLPRLPYVYVPLRFLFKRLAQVPGSVLHPKRLGLTLVGFCFDAIVYLNAQIRIARGTGAGHW